MSPKGRPRVDELIQRISLHSPNPLILHGTIFPFLVIYGLWFYFWVFVFGVDEYYEAGLVSLIAIAFVQIFTCLCCFWSVHFRTFTSCRKVSWSFCFDRMTTGFYLTFHVLEQLAVVSNSCESCSHRKQRIQ